jgi:amino acid adenylation domain-containing protein
MLDVRTVRHDQPRLDTVHGHVHQHAAGQPDSPAILAAGRPPLTYGQLDGQIRYVGQRLRLAGLLAEDRVAVVLPDGADAAVAVLAVAANAVCAPLNPAYSSREFETYLSALRAKALLVPQGIASPAIGVARALNMRILHLVSNEAAAAGLFSLTGDGEIDSDDQRIAAGSDTALLLFTSGTTARPKLAPLTHRQLCVSANHIGSALELTPADCCLGVMPLYHIHGLSTLFASLISGSSYVGMDAFSPDGFAAALDAFQPTWYSAAPAIHRAVLDGAKLLHRDLRKSGLRFIRSASAPMPLQLIADMEGAFGVPVIEAYGMTEAAPQIASNRLPPFKCKPGSVGTAAGPDVAIMDEAGRMLPAGESGEVVIRGPNVIAGYDGGSDANGSFTAGWLRTGDLGHLDADGYLFLAGRLDDVINRGGEKITPAAIETVLLEHPDVVEAVVFAVPHAVLGESVAAAVVPRPGYRGERLVEQIRSFAAGRLARFEVPQQIFIVGQIPLAPAGKVSRKYLAQTLVLDGGLHSVAAMDRTAARNATERRVAEIFAEVLGGDAPGIHADFFALGGHSLAAMQVLARLRQIFQTTLPIDAVFVNPTVARLAERIGEQMANMVADGTARLESQLSPARAASHDDVRIPRRHDAEPAPLSLAQQRVYFLDKMGAGAAYNMSASLWLTGPLDERALGLSLNEIVRRHEVLRSYFPMHGDQPVQAVTPPHEAALAVIDLAADAETERTAEAMRLATQEASQTFDLETGPLFRAKLVRLGREEAVLLLTMHHIVSDGWSIGVLYKELRQLYAAFRDHRLPPLAELPLQYADFAAWQQSNIEQGRLEREAAYWTRQLDHLPPACTFPADRPRPPILSYRGAVEQVFINQQVIDRLKSVGLAENTTLFMTLLAAFKTLLFRYNGQDDCVVGVPIAGRPRKELEALIGFFANTLVMRSSLAGDPPFTELLARIRGCALGAFAHQDMPLERIMETLRIPRDLSRTPLFQVMFAFQNMPDGSGAAPSADLSAKPSFDLAGDLTVRPFRVDNGSAKFDLTLYLSEVDEGMSLTWQFNTDLFDRATIHRLAWQFQTLLEGIADDPRRKLSELPLLSEADSRQAEIDWNRTETRQLIGRNFVQLFEAQAERTPNAPAVEGGHAELSYRELNALANQFARYFQGVGIAHDRPTGVCLPRTPEMLAVLLGIWKAGGAFLPLDPDHPPERIAFKLRDAGVSLLITETALLPSVSAAIQFLAGDSCELPEIVCIDASRSRIASESTRDLETTPAADALAYVIYTSGSTGKPKGVMIAHGNVCHYAQALAQAVGITADDRYLHTASFSFSSSVRQFVVPLSCGATVVIASTDDLRDPQALFETICRRNISVLDFVPSFSASCLQVLMSLEPSARAHLLDSHVRLMLSASEPLPSALVEGWRRLCRPATTFFNMFGQTETTGIVMTYAIPTGGDAAAIVPIGRPISNTQAYILDGSRRLVPVGICGEVYIGGSGVGRGYIHQPEQTARAFIPNPFAKHGSKQLYRTGDLARYRSDGVIEIVGRADEQIKIRGFRIEPGEIEAVIRTHPGIRECVVTAAEDAPDQNRIGQSRSLVAFVVIDRQTLGEPESFSGGLRAFLKQKLPDYMQPQRIVALPRLARTPSGKIDIQALLATLAPRSAAALSAPHAESQTLARSDVEKVLTAIWKKVLRLDHVRPWDNFFDLGGNSKLSLAVMFEAKQAGLKLALRQLYQHQTIAGLARAIGESVPVASPVVHDATVSAEDEAGLLVTLESLRAFGIEVLTRAGLAEQGAEIVTEVQLEASLRGQPTHNMGSIPRYATRIAAGRINANPRIRIEREGEGGTTALIDGDNGPGQWVSTVAMDVAMRKAREQGIGMVSVRRSNHFGAAGHYVWQATRQGLIGLCTTNGPLVLAPTGGVTPTFGNNPLAVGIPAGRHWPILLDIAMSVAPRSKIGLAVAEGRPLPQGWILDRFGRPSTDLADLAAGLGVPIGGHKGYGLALVLEVLAGALSGAGFAADHRADAMNSGAPDYGHMFMAIDPQRFMPASAFAARVDRLIDDIKNGERAANVDDIRIPGEMELRTRERSLTEGVRLAPSTYRALVAYAAEKRFDSTLVVVSTAARK